LGVVEVTDVPMPCRVSLVYCAVARENVNRNVVVSAIPVIPPILGNCEITSPIADDIAMCSRIGAKPPLIPMGFGGVNATAAIR
jgi:hypothetical protein